MSKKMLIDASRSDETRVVVMVDGRIEEIDHETADRRPIKSNIYLARVTRVEPSLQAAFVDYGGNRHGFLPFSEIHPDYYQLPVADRQALLQEVEDKVEERRQRFLNRQKGPRRSASAAAASDSPAVDPDGDQPHVEFPVDENGDFIAPEPLSADAAEADAAEVDETTADENEADQPTATTDAVAATLGLDETLTEQAIVDGAEDTATVTMTGSKDSEDATDADQADAAGDDDDDEPAKTVTAATGTDEEEAVSEAVEDPEDSADADADADEDEADEDDDTVDEEQVAAEGEEESSSAETDAEGGVEEVAVEDVVIEEAGSGSDDDDDDDGDDDDAEETDDGEDSEEGEEGGAAKKSSRSRRRRRSRGRRKSEREDSDAPVSATDSDEADEDDDVDIDDEDDEDIFDEDAERRAIMHSIISRRYKIQEVIKRRQVMLVQVTKEERGNKGAALSSYLSLAGRYCVYMPNTTRGGGISRKISSPKDRRRLKTILDDLNLPQDISIIVRTAGSQRTKAEIKRDYEYLRRTWDGIRETTLTSMAPSLIYEEANVMKRAIRDMYSSDMEEVLVEGEEGYKSAKNFMRVLTPSHAKRVQHHKNEGLSLFQRHKAEQQLDSLFNPVVTLKSGGYLVLNQTEALVAVDVNSGKATKERSIEETALSTNLEAAEEVARQLRLRDLAGLVVIDFIDMDESKHRGQVERKLKESMRGDRARIQLGRISPFGLLELSRQRIRPSVFETTMVSCPVCGGIGVVRSSGSLASSIMRRLGDLLLERDSLDRIEIDAPTDAAIKLLNEHREELAGLEAQNGVQITILPNAHLFSPHFHMRVYTDDKVETFEEGYTSDPTAPKKSDRRRGRKKDARSDRNGGGDDEDSGRKSNRRGRGRTAKVEAEDEDQTTATDATEAGASDDEGEGEGKPRRQRGKRGGRRRNKKDADGTVMAEDDAAEGSGDAATGDDAEQAEAADGDGEKPKRRRGKRGGRNRRKTKAETDAETDTDGDAPSDAVSEAEAAEVSPDSEEGPAAEAEAAETAETETEAPETAEAEAEAEEKPKPKRSRAKKPRAGSKAAKAAEAEAEVEAEAEPAAESEPAADAAASDPEPEPTSVAEEGAASTSHAAIEPDTPKKDGPRKRGWWSRGR